MILSSFKFLSLSPSSFLSEINKNVFKKRKEKENAGPRFIGGGTERPLRGSAAVYALSPWLSLIL